MTAKAFFLPGVDVLGGDKGAGQHVEVGLNQLTACGSRGLAEDDGFAGDRVLQYVTWCDHRYVSFAPVWHKVRQREDRRLVRSPPDLVPLRCRPPCTAAWRRYSGISHDIVT